MRITLDKYPDVLELKEVREILRVGKNKMYTIIKEIPHFRYDRKYYVTKQDLIKYIEQK